MLTGIWNQPISPMIMRMGKPLGTSAYKRQNEAAKGHEHHQGDPHGGCGKREPLVAEHAFDQICQQHEESRYLGPGLAGGRREFLPADAFDLLDQGPFFRSPEAAPERGA